MHPDTEPSVSHPVAPTPARRWFAPLLAGDLAALWPAIVVAFVGVLVIAFAMSYHGLFVFGDVIMRWVTGLSIMAPIGVDVFSLVGLLATFLTRDAPWRVRAYCWIAFGFTVALSIAGNAISAYALLDADAARRNQDFTWGYQQVSAIAGAAFWPALSAVALHVLIVVRRHLDDLRDRVRHAAEMAEREAREAERLAEIERGLEARAVVLAAGGATVSDILIDLDIDDAQRRNVERWTKPVRDALANGKPAAPAKAATRRVTSRTAPDGAAS